MPATYADRLQGLTTSVAVKPPCRVATTGAIMATGLQMIDGVALAEGDRVLVKDQADQTQNGIFISSTRPWERADDFNGTRDAVGGTFVGVNLGATNENSYWRVAGDGPILFGIDEIAFEPVSGNLTLQALLESTEGAAQIGASDGGNVQDALDDLEENQPFAPTSIASLNLTPRPIMRLNTAMQAAILAGSVNITVVGDSIQEPAGISYADSVAENLQRLFQAEFPWMTVNLTNLSIPGRSMSDLADAGYTAPGDFTLAVPSGTNTSYWPAASTNGKSWRDHVKDATPDIIVLALGENDGTDELPFSINYQTFYEYSQTWTKKPWFVLVSSLLPEGSATDRQGKQAIADFMRYKAIEQGFGLIDANSWYRLLRDGKRRDLIPNTEEVDFAGFADPTKWVSTGPTIAGTVVSGAGRVERQVLTRDVDMADYFTLGGDDAVWAANFRTRPGVAGGYAVQTAFADQGDSGGGACRLYYRGSLVAVERFAVKTSGQSLRIRLKAWGPLINVWHDNVLLLSYSSSQGLYAGPFDVGTAAGAGSHAQFRVSFAPEYQAAAEFFSASYLLNDNLHHPTSDGEFQTYIPATKQFVDEFADMLRQPITVTASDSADVTYPTSGSQVLTTPALTFKLAAERTVTVRIRFGYKNANTGAGTLTLRDNGSGVDSIFLEQNSGTNNRQLSYAADLALAAGTHVLDLVETAPVGAASGITSIGAANLRALSATVTII